jgi:hypothetical protein
METQVAVSHANMIYSAFHTDLSIQRWISLSIGVSRRNIVSYLAHVQLSGKYEHLLGVSRGI